MMGDLGRAWRTLCETRFQTGVPLSGLTTIRTGGPARWFLDVENEEEAALAWTAAQAVGVPVLFIGNGSNLLIPDSGYPGLAVHFGTGFSGMSLDGRRVRAQAGVPLKALAFFAADNHLAGLAFAAGIPGSLGGAVFMNAGAFSAEMSSAVESVDCLRPDGKRLRLSLQEARMAYRHTRMMDEGLVVLGAVLLLSPGSRDALYVEMAQFQTLRRDKQPLTWPSAGSFFKRPPGCFAGALIEQAGLKGFRIGGAQVSEKHAGFLINLGGATTTDFIALKDEVQRRVMERFGVMLEPEVRIIPEIPA